MLMEIVATIIESSFVLRGKRRSPEITFRPTSLRREERARARASVTSADVHVQFRADFPQPLCG